jgi:hypothetical protein
LGIVSVVGVPTTVASAVYFAPDFTFRFQKLIAAVLAFLGGGGANFAVWLGAKALYDQARISAEALSKQAADTAKEQKSLETDRYKKEALSGSSLRSRTTASYAVRRP